MTENNEANEVEPKIIDIIQTLSIEETTINLESELIGSNRVLDSMRLVELCLRLEDLAADLEFNFDWKSDDAMSRSSSIFRNVGALIAEFEIQRTNS